MLSLSLPGLLVALLLLLVARAWQRRLLWLWQWLRQPHGRLATPDDDADQQQEKPMQASPNPRLDRWQARSLAARPRRAKRSVAPLAAVVVLAIAVYVHLNGARASQLDLLLLVDAAIRTFWPPHPATIRTLPAARPPVEASAGTGGFLIDWDGEVQRLRVRWAGCGGEARPTELWSTLPGQVTLTPTPTLTLTLTLTLTPSTLPGQAFVAAAASDSVAAESHGNFRVRDRVLAACVAQRVEAVEAAEGRGLELRGGFDDGEPACRAASWKLYLGLADSPPPPPPSRASRLGGWFAGAPPSPVASALSFGLELAPAPAAAAAVAPAAARLNRAQLAFAAPNGPLWGLGVQYRHFDLAGHRVPVFVSEQGIGRGAAETAPMSTLLNALAGGAGGNDYTTYAASASYVSSEGTGLVLHNTELVVFDLNSAGRSRPSILSGGDFGSSAAPSTVALTAHAARLDGKLLAPACDGGGGGGGGGGEGGRFVARSTHLAVLESLTEFTGRMQPLPEWADEGAILGLQGGDATVMRRYEQLKAGGVPIAGLWLQDWVGKRYTPLGDRLWWNYQLDDGGAEPGEDAAAVGAAAAAAGSGRYAGWHRMREAVAPVRLLGYVNPMLSDPSEDVAPGAAPGARRWRRNLYQEAESRGYLVRGESKGKGEGESKGKGEGEGKGKGEGEVYRVEVAGCAGCGAWAARARPGPGRRALLTGTCCSHLPNVAGTRLP